MSWIIKFTINAMVTILSIVFAIAIVELLLIYDDYYLTPERYSVEIEENEYLFIDKNVVPFFSQQMSESSDIFVVGDSLTEGVHCVRNEFDFPARLQVYLDGQFKVHNLGIRDKNPADYVDIVAKLKLDKADTVIIVLYDNDIHVNSKNCKQIQRQAQSSDLYIPNFCNANNEMDLNKKNLGIIQQINNQLAYIKPLRTVRLIKESFVNIPFFSKYFYRSELLARWTNYDAEETKWIISSLVLLDKIVKEKGADIKFTYYPNTNAISDFDPRHSIWLEFILEVNKRTGINIDDPYPFFIRNAISDSMVWSLTDKHPSCEAHDFMAKHISKLIVN
tara:strand:- start:492 stop:1493 length:1002 start_codon:yes stop_codon:yes gene_type:complete